MPKFLNQQEQLWQNSKQVTQRLNLRRFIVTVSVAKILIQNVNQ